MTKNNHNHVKVPKLQKVNLLSTQIKTLPSFSKGKDGLRGGYSTNRLALLDKPKSS